MKWRLHLDPPQSGPYNMAKDAYGLKRTQASGRPELRLYRWQGAVLSLGRGQKMEREVNLSACAREQVAIVRRSTGGRAVLHGDDLTYSVAAPTNLPGFQGGILPIYAEISRVFVEFFRTLGQNPEVKTYSGRERGEKASAICFSTPSAFEILLGGKKMVGSAQRLSPKAFLQHGSLPLLPRYEQLSRLFHGADAAQLAEQMTDMTTLGILSHLSLEGVQESLVNAFSEILGAEFEQEPWGAEEESQVRELMADYPLLGEGTAPTITPASPAAGMAGD